MVEKQQEALQTLAKNIGYAYAPYSHFQVGAAILTNTQDVYYGYNIENASYGATICAERSAFSNAIAHGVKKEDITSILIYSPQETLVYPCGICRQVMVELLPRAATIWISNGVETIQTTMDALLPNAFSEEDL